MAQICAAFATVIFLTYALVYLYFDHWPVTHQDFWRIYDIFLNHSWWESATPKFNNHSLFFPSIFWIADLRLFHGSQEPLFYLGLMLLFLTITLLLIPVWQAEKTDLTVKLVATLIVVAGNFWMGRASIITSAGFTCIGSLSLVGTLLAFLFLPALQPGTRRPWMPAIIVLAGGFISSFSSSSGLITWPVLLLLGWGLRLPRSSLGIVFAGGVSAAIIFALLPDPAVAGRISHESFSLFSVAFIGLEHLCRLLGSPILAAKAAWSSAEITREGASQSLFSLCCGAIGLLLACIVTLPRMIRRDLRPNGVQFIGLALLYTNFLIMLMIAVGRAPLLRLKPFEVAAPRYFFWSSLFWASLLLVFLDYAVSRPPLRWMAILIGLATPILLFPSHYKEGVHWHYAYLHAQSAATGLINGIRDDDYAKLLFRDPKRVYHVARELRRRRLDMFAEGLQDWIGGSEATLFKVPPVAMGLKGRGRIDKLVEDWDGKVAARVVGTLNTKNQSAPHVLVISNARGDICGIGRSSSLNQLINRVFYLRAPQKTVDFLGYIRNFDPHLSYSVRSAERRALSADKIPVHTGSVNGLKP